MSGIARYKTVLHFKRHNYIVEISHAAAVAAMWEQLFLQTLIQKKKGSKNRFPLKGKNSALQAEDNILKYPQTVGRNQNNPFNTLF